MRLIEALEPRHLLSGDPFHVTSKGTFIVTGTDGDDSIVVQLKGNKRAYGFLATVAAAPDAGSQPTSVTYTFTGKFYAVKRIEVDGGAGDDRLFVNGGPEMTRPVTILGGAGNDVIGCDNAGATFIDGGSGADTIGPTFQINVASHKNRDVLDALFKSDGGAVNTIMGGSGGDLLSGDINDVVDGGVGDSEDFAKIQLLSDMHISSNRAKALAHDYFRRIGAVHFEEYIGGIGRFG